MTHQVRNRLLRRNGSVYLAVLGTALVVSTLGLTAIMLERVQHRSLSQSTDIRQAQLNAKSALELALLTISQDPSWRARPHGEWFVERSLGTHAGSATIEITDPLDENLQNSADDVIHIRATGYYPSPPNESPPDGAPLSKSFADQRIELVLEPVRQPLACLREGNNSAPDWGEVLAYYQQNGTEIPLGNLPNGHPVNNFARNADMEMGWNDHAPYWIGGEGEVPGTGSSQIQRSSNEDRSGRYSLRVRNRSTSLAGPSQSVAHFLKPNASYYVEAWVRTSGLAQGLISQVTWRFTLRAQTTDNQVITLDSKAAWTGPQSSGWTRIRAPLIANNAPAISADWSDRLHDAWVTVSCGVLIINPDFYMDDFLIREQTPGRFIYKETLAPGRNPWGPSHPNDGLYWIDCQGEDLIIERSRIFGTLLVLNPGPQSRVEYGPCHWTPARTGYPALIVDGDFSLRHTPSPLDEQANATNYNPHGAPDRHGNSDNDTNDQYDSQIRGLVAISGNLSYQNEPAIQGQVVVGGNVSGSTSNFTHRPDSLLSPPPGFFKYRYDVRPGSVRRGIVAR